MLATAIMKPLAAATGRHPGSAANCAGRRSGWRPALRFGELYGGWKLRWRMELFYLLVRLQAFWPVMPRFSFSSPASASSNKEM
jgi:hypothetical protein